MNFLKLSIMALTVAAATTVSAQQEPGTRGGSDIGSAFVNDNILYVTVLGDCNAMGGDLQIDPKCDANRLAKDFRPLCSAELLVTSTEMACPADKTKVPHILEIDLKKTNLTHEAQILNLKVNGQEITVKLK